MAKTMAMTLHEKKAAAWKAAARSWEEEEKVTRHRSPVDKSFLDAWGKPCQREKS
jgi:hypothetical protein